MTEPIETYDDGGALYEAGPFEVAAQPPGVNPGAVSIDGRTLTPHTARLLARVLEVAADRAQGGRPAEPDPGDAATWQQRADLIHQSIRAIRDALPALHDVADDATERARIAANTSMYQATERPADTDRDAAYERGYDEGFTAGKRAALAERPVGPYGVPYGGSPDGDDEHHVEADRLRAIAKRPTDLDPTYRTQES